MEVELRNRYSADYPIRQSDAPPPEPNRSTFSSKCIRIACKVANIFKQIGIGVVGGGIACYGAQAFTFVACKLGLLTEIAPTIAEQLVESAARAGIELDVNACLNAVCPIQEFVTQMKNAFPEVNQMSVLKYKVMTLEPAIIGPIQEEFLFRFIIQKYLLRDLPKEIIKQIAPGKESALDSRTASAIRVVLSAALFSTAHLTNIGLAPDSHIHTQLVTTFVGGIFIATLNESKAGFLGALSAHITNNVIALSPHLLSC